MTDIGVINEIMAVLGFLVPSSVLWVAWGIRASSEAQKKKIDTMAEEIAWLKRNKEDEILLNK